MIGNGLVRTTIGGFLDRNAKKFSDKDALVFADRNLRYSWKELNRICDMAAKAFLKVGIRKGDHVALWATNYPEWVITQFALAKIGAILVTINPEWKASELKYALKQSDSKALVMIEGFEKISGDKVHQYSYIDIVKEACPELIRAESPDLGLETFPLLKKIILITRNEKRPKWVLGWNDFLNLGHKVNQICFKFRKLFVSPFDVCLIQYTSGTTGFPKGAMLTHYNVVNNALEGSRNMELTSNDRLCGPVPYYHCFGSIMLNLCCLVSGATMVVPSEHFNARQALEAIEKEKCTAIHGVPTMFIAELADKEFGRFNPASLRTGIIAGAPCPIELMKDIISKMGAKKITIVYGLTEASPITHQTRPDDSIELRVSTVGKPLNNTEAKIIDDKEFDETGKIIELGTGEIGEIWVFGPNIMQGYYKKPEETKKALVGGWLRTGDLGVKTDSGYYKIVGRCKDMYIVGGHNVYPAEVEQVLLSLFGDCVEDVQVVGVPHKTLQEVGAATIKLRPGKTLTFEEIKKKCESQMEWPKIPRYVKFVQDFSGAMTVTGKIQKIKLRQMLIKELGLEELAKIKTA